MKDRVWVAFFASLNSTRHGRSSGSFLTVAVAVIAEKAEAPLMIKFYGIVL